MPQRIHALVLVTGLMAALLMLSCARTHSLLDMKSLVSIARDGRVAGRVEQDNGGFSVVQLTSTASSAYARNRNADAMTSTADISISRTGQQPPLAFLRPGEAFRLRNDDQIHHEIRTVDQDNPLRVRLSAGERTDPMRFETAGLVRGYCRMHPSESFSFLVAEASHFVYVEGDRSFEIEGVPPGSYEVRATGIDGRVGETSVDVTPGKRVEVTLRPKMRIVH